jgi:antitoxin YefM
MNTKPYSYVRQNLASVLDEVCDSRAPLTITRQSGKEVVMISREEYEALEETFHLIRSPKNLARLSASIAEANAGKAKVRKGFKG